MRTSVSLLGFFTGFFSILAGCAPGLPTEAQEDHQESASVLMMERGGALAQSFFDDAQNAQADQPGACAALSSYEVVTSGDVGELSEADVVLENRCDDQDLLVYRVELLDYDDAFQLQHAPPTRLAPGEHTTIAVDFEARVDGPLSGELLIATDDGPQVASLVGSGG